ARRGPTRAQRRTRAPAAPPRSGRRERAGRRSLPPGAGRAPTPSPAPDGRGRERVPPAGRGTPRRAGSSERAGGLAVHPRALAAEDEATQPQRRAQQPPHAGSLPRPVVLVEELDERLDVLPEHAPAVRRGADVDDLGLGQEPDLPPGAAKAVEPAGLLPEPEERLVEQADGGGRRAAEQEARPPRPLDLARLVMVEVAGVV